MVRSETSLYFLCIFSLTRRGVWLHFYRLCPLFFNISKFQLKKRSHLESEVAARGIDWRGNVIIQGRGERTSSGRGYAGLDLQRAASSSLNLEGLEWTKEWIPRRQKASLSTDKPLEGPDGPSLLFTPSFSLPPPIHPSGLTSSGYIERCFLKPNPVSSVVDASMLIRYNVQASIETAASSVHYGVPRTMASRATMIYVARPVSVLVRSRGPR